MIYYVSHPFTGNPGINRRKARAVTVYLQQGYPEHYFYNPLDAMQAQAMAGLDYNAILTLCLDMLYKCDGIIMTGNYNSSRGCNTELVAARFMHKPIYMGVADFEERNAKK